MKSVIFCGGKGTRLREETEFRPKPLVEIGGRPIIWHIMKLYSYWGIKDFILTLGYKGDMIKRYFMEYHWINGDFSINLSGNSINIQNSGEMSDDWNVTCAETGLESLTALRLFLVKKYLTNEEDFCVTYGDGVSNLNIKEVIKFHKKNGKIVTITGVHPKSKYGLFLIDNNNIATSFQEKPVLNDIINGGFMVVNKRIFDYLSPEKNIMFEQVIEQLTELGEVSIFKFEGFWQSMDTFQDFESLNKLWATDPKWKIWD